MITKTIPSLLAVASALLVGCVCECPTETRPAHVVTTGGEAHVEGGVHVHAGATTTTTTTTTAGPSRSAPTTVVVPSGGQAAPSGGAVTSTGDTSGGTSTVTVRPSTGGTTATTTPATAQAPATTTTGVTQPSTPRPPSSTTTGVSPGLSTNVPNQNPSGPVQAPANVQCRTATARVPAGGLLTLNGHGLATASRVRVGNETAAIVESSDRRVVARVVQRQRTGGAVTVEVAGGVTAACGTVDIIGG